MERLKHGGVGGGVTRSGRKFRPEGAAGARNALPAER